MTENARLRAALEPFAKIALVRDTDATGPDAIDAPDLAITADDVRRAREALAAPADAVGAQRVLDAFGKSDVAMIEEVGATRLVFSFKAEADTLELLDALAALQAKRVRS